MVLRATLSVSIFTKKSLQEWKKLHYPMERKTYDQIIQLLLEESARKNPDHLKFNLNSLEKKVFSLVQEQHDTSRRLIEIMSGEMRITQRSIQNALESLRRKKLLDRRIRKGREYYYFVPKKDDAK